ncbi:unnamed protein product [Ixodes persulcatus]
MREHAEARGVPAGGPRRQARPETSSGGSRGVFWRREGEEKGPHGIFRAPMPPNSWVNPVVAPGCWSELVVDGPLSG